MSAFHRVCGREVQLSRRRRTAKRRHSRSEYDQGIVFSADPLADGQLFEILLEDVQRGWSGSIEVGVTSVDPASRREIPASATALGRGSVVLSGRSVWVDGSVVNENFSVDLDELEESSRIGVAVIQGELHVFVNGADQGVVRGDIRLPVRAVVDVYGCCVQVSITENNRPST